MCGITGFIEFNSDTTTSDVYLSKMVEIMHRRGPDASNFKLYDTNNYKVGLGHARLSVIDLSDHATQPFTADELSIVFNGEIYNFQEIKDELIGLGYHFLTTSDTEVVLKAFKAWGVNAVDKFIGMFAFAIYDQSKEEMYFFRDRSGVKPFYYYWDEQTFIFGSELKAFHFHPGFKKSIDKGALGLYLQYGYIPFPNCIFEKTNKLEPGHYIKFDLKRKRIDHIKYWDVYDYYNKPKLNISYEEALEETERLFISAFNYRMVADVPVGVFLSGGYDSTAVASILKQTSSSQINTFTVGFEDEQFNEAEYAKETAKFLGTNHTEHYCTYQDALDIIPNLAEIFDEPFGDSSAIPTTLVSGMARKDVTVCLSADGGDEIFAGYNKYTRTLNTLNKLSKVPKNGRKLVGKLMDLAPIYKLPLLKNGEKIEHFYKIISELYRNDELDAAAILKHSTKNISDGELNEYFTDSFIRSTSAFDTSSLIDLSNDQINRMLAIDYKTYMCDDILTKVDRASMSVSLEGREPLLDHRIVEFAAQLPSSYKMKDGVKKRILKDVVHKYVPKEMMDRPKSGFGIPVKDWGRREFKDLFEQYFSEQYVREQGIFNPKKISNVLQDYLNGNDMAFQPCWFILNFQMWYSRWMG